MGVDGCSGDSPNGGGRQTLEVLGKASFAGSARMRHEFLAAPPGGHDNEHERRDRERKPAARRDLRDVCREKWKFHGQEHRGGQTRRPSWPAPARPGEQQQERRRQKEIRGDRQSVSCGEPLGVLENEDDRCDGDEKQQIDGRKVDLA